MMKKLPIVIISTSLLVSTAFAAGFDCTKASTEVEKTICADAVLSKLDEELMHRYKKELNLAAEHAEDLRAYQLQWLKFQRNTCPDASCLIREYKERLGFDIRYGVAWDNPETLTTTDLPSDDSFDHFFATMQPSMTNSDPAEGMDVYDKNNRLSIYSVSAKPYLAVVDSVLLMNNAHRCDLTDQLAKWSENHWVINHEFNNQLVELRIYPTKSHGKTELLLKDVEQNYSAVACDINGYFDGLVFTTE